MILWLILPMGARNRPLRRTGGAVPHLPRKKGRRRQRRLALWATPETVRDCRACQKVVLPHVFLPRDAIVIGTASLTTMSQPVQADGMATPFHEVSFIRENGAGSCGIAYVRGQL